MTADEYTRLAGLVRKWLRNAARHEEAAEEPDVDEEEKFCHGLEATALRQCAHDLFEAVTREPAR